MTKEEPSISVLRKVVLDVFFIAGLTTCIFVMKDYWEPFQRGFFCSDESLMYPYHEDTITTPMLRVYSLAVPMLVMVICEWTLLRIEQSDTCVLGVSVPAWVCGIYCAVVSFGLGACFVDFATEISKHVIGRPRPHFFDVCQPSVNCSAAEWRGRYVQSHEYFCVGTHWDRIKDMRKSFVSGHSSLIGYAMTYLAFYLEQRVTWQGTRVARHSLQFGAFTVSWFTALSRVSDYKHHWSDVLAGYSLGVVFAVLVLKKNADPSLSTQRILRSTDDLTHHQEHNTALSGTGEQIWWR